MESFTCSFLVVTFIRDAHILWADLKIPIKMHNPNEMWELIIQDVLNI